MKSILDQSTACSSVINSLISEVSMIYSTSGISSMGVTRTEKGLTNRQILFGLKKGSVLGMIRRYFDPRRPLTMTESHK